MSSIRCPQCDLLNWATEPYCKRCGLSFRPSEAIADPNVEVEIFSDLSMPQNSVSGSEAQRPEHNWITDRATHSSGGQTHQTELPNRKSGLALLSIILGITGLPPFCSYVGLAVGGILAVAFGQVGFLIGLALAFAVVPSALVTGIVAFRRANSRPSEYTGKGLAVAGIVCGLIGFLIIPIIAAIAVPNLMASRRAANEGRAISTMRKLADVEVKLSGKVASKGCVDIQTLALWNLVDWSMKDGTQSGYHYEIVDLPKGGCEILGTPISPSAGARSFYFSTTDGVLREGTKEGKPADKSDLPVQEAFTNVEGPREIALKRDK